MFRPMRRHRQQLSQGDCAAILSRGPPASWPWPATAATPMRSPSAMCIRRELLFFHCAKAGHKLDALRRCSKASFCVIDQDQVVPRSTPPTFAASSPSAGPVFWRTRRRNKLPFGSWRRNTAPATAGASPGGHSPGGRRTVPCVALHRAHDRQAGHRAGSGRPPARLISLCDPRSPFVFWG